MALDVNGPMRFVRVAEQTGLDYSHTQQRLLRLQADGLVTRTDPRHGAPYVLTDAGRALGPVYAVVGHWSVPCPRDGPRRLPPPSQQPSEPTPASRWGGRCPDRSGPAPEQGCAGLPVQPRPQPQPRVPSYVTAQSAPGRSR
ncbi:winged helix-turn-helix transcriptional regulator [Streptomyces hydrogenans]